jgi:hypothetical protein
MMLSVGRRVTLKEWDGSFSRGIVRALSVEYDLVLVEYDDGERQRLSLSWLEQQAEVYLNLN